MDRFAYIILLIAVLIYKTADAQVGLPRLIIKNADTDAPVARVHAKDRSSGALFISGQGGLIDLEKALFPLSLELSHIGYEERTIAIHAADLLAMGPLPVYLMPRAIELPPLEVKRQAPEVVYQREDLHVGDYHVDQDGLWVLVYDKPQLWHRQERAGEQLYKGARLHLLDTLFRERAIHTFRERVNDLHSDHLQRVVVEGELHAWVAEARGEVIALGVMDKETMQKALLPWKDTLGGFLLGDDRVDDWPAFAHLAYDPVKQETRTICTVEDRHVMELFRSQYKYMSGADKVTAMRFENATGIDKEIYAGYMTGFHRDMYFSVPYAPLFRVADTICVFDHVVGVIRKFNRHIEPSGEVPLPYNMKRDRVKSVLQDPADGSIYTLHVRGPSTFLRRIDTSSGSLGPSFTLTHPFPEDVKVFDGHAWYIYRPYGSTQQRTLYRERIP